MYNYVLILDCTYTVHPFSVVFVLLLLVLDVVFLFHVQQFILGGFPCVFVSASGSPEMGLT